MQTDATGPPHHRTQILWWIFAAALLIAGHLFVTSTAWTNPLARLPGPTGDNCMMIWNLGWVKYALDHGSPGFWCSAAYHPHGFLFIYGSHTWLDGFLYWLTSWLLPGDYHGAILWANITLLTATVATGLLTISALRAWRVGNWPVLLLAGTAVAFSWFRMYAMFGHYNFTGTQWMMAALCLLSWARRFRADGLASRARWFTVAAGVFMGLAALNDQTMAIFAAIIGLLILLTIPGDSLQQRLRRALGGAAMYYAAAAVVASVHLVPIAMAAASGKLDYYHVDKSLPRLVDATSLLLPNDYHFLGVPLKGLREKTGLAWSEGTYFGIIPLLLLLCGTAGAAKFLITRKPEYRVCFYAAAAAWGFIIIVLGDRLMIGPNQYFTLPARILKEIPLLNNMRVPQRWVWPAHLATALAGASAISVWMTARGRAWRWAPLAVALIPILEGRPHPMPDPVDYHSEFMQPEGLIPALRAAHQEGAVLTMPTEVTYAQANVVQFLAGYDIPFSVVYSARMPLDVNQIPWKWAAWTPEAAPWLLEREVRTVVLPFHDGKPEEFAPWIREAKAAVPGLVVLNKHGERL
jgi:hypothetical protein